MEKKLLRVARDQDVVKESIAANIDCFFVGDNVYIEPGHIPFKMNTSKKTTFLSLNSYDVVMLRNEKLDVLFDASSTENAVLVTNRCNSNCIMCPCSEKWRNMQLDLTHEDNMELLRLIPKNTRYLCLTGGEPTLAGNDFIKLLSYIKHNLALTKLMILTNGRTFSNSKFFGLVSEHAPVNTRFAIPIYNYCSEKHDRITNSEKSFEQTTLGIKRLLSEKKEVELRIVVNRLNYDDLDRTAEYIIANFRGVASVNFMAMEMMGAALMNREKIWVDYEKCFLASKSAIRKLVSAGFNVELYNFPLCKVEKGYWNICSKSISDYKAKYESNCDGCSVKSRCGGVFSSTLAITKMELTPIKEAKND